MNKKICVVGGGNWGINHIKTLDRLNALGGIVELDEERLNFFREKFPKIQYFNNLDDALSKDFDGFTIATPANSHYAIAKKIINSNFHVLIEKPFTTDVDQAIELNKLAKIKKVNLMVGHVLLFHPAFIKIKSILDSGELGDLQYMYSNRLNLGTIRTEENVFWSFAPHDIALFQYFSNSNPVKISSNGIDIIQNNVHDSTLTTLEYPNKIMGHIFVSWLHPFKEHRFVLIGSNGMISFEDSHKDKPLLWYNKKVIIKNGVPITDDKGIKSIDYSNDMPLDNEMKYFINTLDGSSVNISNGESAIEVMKILTMATTELLES